MAFTVKRQHVLVSGTFTPTYTFATPGDLNVVYSTQTGVFIKDKRIVWINVKLAASTFTHSTAASTFLIGGLPYACDLESGLSLIDINAGFSWTASYTGLGPRVVSGSSQCRIGQFRSANARATMDIANVPTGGTPAIEFSGWYRTAS
jgi:hypothetical protein